MPKGNPNPHTTKMVEFKKGTLEKLADPDFPEDIKKYHMQRARLVRGLNAMATGMLDKIAVTEQIDKLVDQIDAPDSTLTRRQRMIWRARVIKMAGQVGVVAVAAAQKEVELENQRVGFAPIAAGNLSQLSTEELRRLIDLGEKAEARRVAAGAPVDVAVEVKE